MATGDKIYIADKETLDGVKETVDLMKPETDKISGINDSVSVIKEETKKSNLLQKYGNISEKSSYIISLLENPEFGLNQLINSISPKRKTMFQSHTFSHEGTKVFNMSGNNIRLKSVFFTGYWSDISDSSHSCYVDKFSIGGTGNYSDIFSSSPFHYAAENNTIIKVSYHTDIYCGNQASISFYCDDDLNDVVKCGILYEVDDI